MCLAKTLGVLLLDKKGGCVVSSLVPCNLRSQNYWKEEAFIFVGLKMDFCESVSGDSVVKISALQLRTLGSALGPGN